MLALTDANNVVGVEDLDDDMSQHLAVCSMDLLERLRSVIDDEEERMYVLHLFVETSTGPKTSIFRATALQPSTVQTVLQKSQYAILASRDTSYTSPLFTSTSWHLHDARKSMTWCVELDYKHGVTKPLIVPRISSKCIQGGKIPRIGTWRSE